ncbi:MAG: putative ABC transport system permease protein [Hyphomicrobiaceae bacterium]
MFRLLALVSRRELAARPYRVILFVCAVAVGIAMVTAMRVSTDRIVTAYSDRLLQMSGRADLQVTLGTGEAGFDEELTARVKAVPGVKAAGAVVRGALVFEDGEVLELYGIDLLDDDIRQLYDFEVLEREPDDFTIVNDAHAVFLPEAVAARRGLTLGDSVAMISTVGRAYYTVRGMIEPPSMARAYGGRIAAMYLPAAQAVTGRRGKLGFSLIDQIDVALAEGESLEEVQAGIAKIAGSDFAVMPPAQRRVASARTVEGLRSTLIGMSSVALLAAMFIVYATTAGLVVSRSPQAATLLSLGMQRRTIVVITILEAGLLGLLGSCIGVGVGYALAGFVAPDVAGGMSLNYSMDFGVGESQSGGTGLFTVALQHCLLGCVAAALSAAVPARALLHLDPLEIRNQRVAMASRLAESSLFANLGAVSVALAGVGALVWGVRVQDPVATATGGVLVTFGFVLVSLPFLRHLVRAFAAILRRTAGVPGRIAGEELERSWGHIATTVAAIGLCIGVAIAAGSLARSFRSSVGSWYGFSGDALVTSRRSEGGWLAAPIPLFQADRIAALPEVAAVETLRVSHGRFYRGERIAWAAVSRGFAAAALDESRRPECSDCADALASINAGQGVGVSRNFALRFGAMIGDPMRLGTTPVLSSLPIVAIVDDYVSDKGSILMSRELYVSATHDERTNFVGVLLADGASVDDLRSSLFQSFDGGAALTVVSTGEMMARVGGMIRQAFADVDTIQFLVVIITLAAIINLFFASVLERRREFALLRIVGADRETVRRATVLEGVVIACTASALGTLTGAVAAWTWVRFSYPVLVGYVLNLDFAWPTAGICFILAVVSAVGASYAATAGDQAGEQLAQLARLE